MDCAYSRYGVYGCNGGWMHKAMDYLKDNYIKTERDYPYKAYRQSCKYGTRTVTSGITKLRGRYMTRRNDESNHRFRL